MGRDCVWQKRKQVKDGQEDNNKQEGASSLCYARMYAECTEYDIFLLHTLVSFLFVWGD